MKRNGKPKRQLRRGAKIMLRNEFKTGGVPARVYPAGSVGKIIPQAPEHENNRDIKTVQMEEPPGVIRAHRTFLMPA